MGDHTETLQVDFDSDLISLEQLLDTFWRNHTPRKDGYGGHQYMSLLLFHNSKQNKIIDQVKVKWEAKTNQRLETEIKPFEQFTLAEDKHQKYYFKRSKKAYEMILQLFSTHEDFVNSTIAARLNGFVREFGTLHDLKNEINEWRLDEKDRLLLIETIKKLKW